MLMPKALKQASQPPRRVALCLRSECHYFDRETVSGIGASNAFQYDSDPSPLWSRPARAGHWAPNAERLRVHHHAVQSYRY